MQIKPYLSRLLALVLVLAIGLMGCSGDTTSGLTGKYIEDTLAVVQTLNTAMDLPKDAENKSEIQTKAREQINDYIARYRRDGKVSGLRSFTTMQTALNSLAGYYTAYGSRPISPQLKERLQKEFSQVELIVKRGA